MLQVMATAAKKVMNIPMATEKQFSLMYMPMDTGEFKTHGLGAYYFIGYAFAIFSNLAIMKGIEFVNIVQELKERDI